MSLQYHQGDERPPWSPTITVDGTSEDYSTGYTFTVEVKKGADVEFTKTTGITGAVGSVVVDWATTNELSTLDPGGYTAFLRVRRTSDSKDITVMTSLSIRSGVS